MLSHLCQARSLSDIDDSLQHDILDQLHRARSKNLLTVCLQIHLGFFLICSLSSNRTSFALSTDNEKQAPSRSLCPYLKVFARKAASHGIPDPTRSIIHAV